MTKQEYLYYRYIYMEYGRDLLAEFANDKDKFNLPSLKDISKGYVDKVKSFLAEMNKDTPNEEELKKHIANLGNQHYKMYLKLN